MTRLALRLLIGFSLTVPASQALAEPTVWECRARQIASIDDIRSRYENLVQPTMRFTIDGDNATVEDPLIRGIVGGPIAGEVTENTDGKWVVRWSYSANGFGGIPGTMLFRAAFLKKRSELIVTQSIPTANTTFQGRGTCIAL